MWTLSARHSVARASNPTNEQAQTTETAGRRREVLPPHQISSKWWNARLGDRPWKVPRSLRLAGPCQKGSWLKEVVGIFLVFFFSSGEKDGETMAAQRHVVVLLHRRTKTDFHRLALNVLNPATCQPRQPESCAVRHPDEAVASAQARVLPPKAPIHGGAVEEAPYGRFRTGVGGRTRTGTRSSQVEEEDRK